MDLSIIIVSWNVKEKLRENLESLFSSEGRLDFEVFVVDNASSDGTLEMVKSDFPGVKLIVNEMNFGFARANNQAIKISKGRYILLLNPDMRVFPDTLSSMISWMEGHKQALAAGCHLLGNDGTNLPHVRNFPKLSDQLAIVLKIPHLFPGILNDYLRSDFDYSQDSSVDSIRGGFFMLRRETIDKVGLLDERFFLWFEEVDYCRRIKKAGGEVWYTNAASCVDLVGQSFVQLKRGTAQSYFQDSQVKYFQKWHPAWQSLVLKCVWPIGKTIAVIGSIFIKNQKNHT